ncbi:hypothetical protein [Paraflavitalea sp. CAU 1676]|uniref:hypothetical protein n=1 Tax=Paraflavitalea sp. CAU 1676 TaxID=3032598 RepID=UPI0023D9A5F5|nr:hypothetical protein [Paraflavitalea sp. CAU 1676]MDF2187297.1 hypothetical protein [Paraflavitalea sp. CAU 1676]
MFRTNKILAVIIIMLMLASCDAQLNVGMKKDLSNGITTSWKNMEPKDVVRIMNGEKVSHNQVVLGESFAVVNQGVKGLVVKEGKVSVGCSLKIIDSTGKTLLTEPDLFKGNDVWDKEKATDLKCTVNTGKPMDWQQEYQIVVTFWDKYGKGKLENRLTAYIEDIP